MTTKLRSNNNIPLIDVLSGSRKLDRTNITNELKPIIDQDTRKNTIRDTYDNIDTINPLNQGNDGYVDPEDYKNLIQDNRDILTSFEVANQNLNRIDDNDTNVKNQAYVNAISQKITSLAQRLAVIQRSNTNFMKNIRVRVNVILNRIYHVHVNIDSINNNRALIADLRNQITILIGQRDNLINQITQAEQARDNAFTEAGNLRAELNQSKTIINNNNIKIRELQDIIDRAVNEINALKGRIAELETQANVNKDEIDQLKLQIIQLNDVITQNNSRIDSLTQQNEELNNKVEEMTSNLLDLTFEIETEREANRQTTEALVNLNNQIDQGVQTAFDTVNNNNDEIDHILTLIKEIEDELTDIEQNSMNGAGGDGSGDPAPDASSAGGDGSGDPAPDGSGAASGGDGSGAASGGDGSGTASGGDGSGADASGAVNPFDVPQVPTDSDIQEMEQELEREESLPSNVNPIDIPQEVNDLFDNAPERNLTEPSNSEIPQLNQEDPLDSRAEPFELNEEDPLNSLTGPINPTDLSSVTPDAVASDASGGGGVVRDSENSTITDIDLTKNFSGKKRNRSQAHNVFRNRLIKILEKKKVFLSMSNNQHVRSVLQYLKNNSEYIFMLIDNIKNETIEQFTGHEPILKLKIFTNNLLLDETMATFSTIRDLNGIDTNTLIPTLERILEYQIKRVNDIASVIPQNIDITPTGIPHSLSKRGSTLFRGGKMKTRMRKKRRRTQKKKK